MRSGWLPKRLGDIAEVQTGGTPRRSESSNWGGTIPWYSSGELNHRFTTAPERHITEAGLSGSNAKLFPAGSLMIGMYDTAALKMSLLDRPGTFNQAIAGVKPSENINLVFLLHAINSIKPEVLAQRRGVRQKNLNLGKIRNILVPLPPLPEQERIVAILDEAFEAIDTAIANTETNLENARELFESYLTATLERPSVAYLTKKLDSICVIERGSSPRPIKQYITDDPDGVNWVKIGDTKGVTKLIKSTKQKITKKGAERSRRVDAGDLILSNSMSYGKPYVMATDGYIHDGWFVLRLKPEMDVDYLYYALSSRLVQDQFSGLAAGAVVKNISSDLVKRALIPVPSLTDQKHLVAAIEDFSAATKQIEAAVKRKLTSLQELKQSILQKAFSGELTASAEPMLQEAGL